MLRIRTVVGHKFAGCMCNRATNHATGSPGTPHRKRPVEEQTPQPQSLKPPCLIYNGYGPMDGSCAFSTQDNKSNDCRTAKGNGHEIIGGKSSHLLDFINRSATTKRGANPQEDRVRIAENQS